LAVLDIEDGYRAAKALPDSVSFGEDLSANLALTARLAPACCTVCQGYHLRYVASRLTDAKTPINHDRRQLAEVVGRYAAARPGPTHVLIAGAADTGILATCAHGVAAAGLGAPRVGYTVLDICETPLALCRAFAGRHGLDVQTVVADLRKPETRLAADLVIVHSVLRQIEADFHRPIMEELRSWLGPDGRIVFSNRLGKPFRLPKKRRRERLLERVEKGEVTLPIPLEDILAAFDRSVDQPHEFETIGEMHALFDAAGLAVESEHVVEPPPEEPGDASETRYLAVLAAGRP
jgi:hypothetical protein